MYKRQVCVCVCVCVCEIIYLTIIVCVKHVDSMDPITGMEKQIVTKKSVVTFRIFKTYSITNINFIVKIISINKFYVIIWTHYIATQRK